jgi:hypothetical protein
MGLDSFSAGSNATRIFVAVLFVSSFSLFAAEPMPSPVATTNAAGPGTIENSAVKIFATVRYPDPYKPWTKDSPEEQTGSGVVIEGRRILTNAHVVDYECNMRYGETMIFPRAQMLAATDEILTDNGVRSQGSPDTLAIWNSKPAK